ncbi:hypothetical protein TNCT_676811 [Trichonephila clavata]|uniref:Uncharacterized protein n=1 Tax=Trichonephila clavata TaxID=2740835 RepID=A0A8X6K9J7_TRICU|nr:hypothetical protein TNCT_676811 [Trichonephila clavata]
MRRNVFCRQAASVCQHRQGCSHSTRGHREQPFHSEELVPPSMDQLIATLPRPFLPNMSAEKATPLPLFFLPHYSHKEKCSQCTGASINNSPLTVFMTTQNFMTDCT